MTEDFTPLDVRDEEAHLVGAHLDVCEGPDEEVHGGEGEFGLSELEDCAVNINIELVLVLSNSR